MAEKSRTLKLSILGDVDNLLDSFKKAEKATQSHTDQLADYGKKAALVFAAAGAAAGAFAVSAIKAAAEDQKAQEALANTIRNTTKATEAQIAGVDQWISRTSVAIGVTDDQLRPAFERLVRSTKDVGEAQKATSLALDLATAAHVPLEVAANALGKSYDGNYTALGKLGLGLDSNLLKSKDQKAIMEELTRVYGDFAEKQAETTAVKFERMTIAMGEAKEAIGAALMPAVEGMATWLVENGIPILDAFVLGITGKGGLIEGASKAQETAYAWGAQFLKVIKVIWAMKEELLGLGTIMGAVFVATRIVAFVTATVAAVKALIGVYNALKASAIVAGVASYFALNPLAGIGATAIAAGVLSAASALSNKFNVDVPNIDQFINTASSAASGTTGAFVAPDISKVAVNTSSYSAATTGAGAAALAASTKSKEPISLDLALINANLADIGTAQKTLALQYLQQQANTMATGGATRQATQDYLATNNYITVQGAIDPEGTARTIIDILNKAYSRGTTNLVLSP